MCVLKPVYNSVNILPGLSNRNQTQTLVLSSIHHRQAVIKEMHFCIGFFTKSVAVGHQCSTEGNKARLATHYSHSIVAFLSITKLTGQHPPLQPVGHWWPFSKQLFTFFIFFSYFTNNTYTTDCLF